MERFFDQDKNYILKSAQLDFKDQAVELMIDIAIDSYLRKNNPLGLIDDFVLQLQQYQNPDTEFLYKPYHLLSAVYRLLHSDNQLEFNWSGKSHNEIFTEEWRDMLGHWMRKMTLNSYLDKLIIKGAIINPYSDHSMLEAHINKIIYKNFPVRKTRKGTLKVA
jgi:hypothetical protein